MAFKVATSVAASSSTQGTAGGNGNGTGWVKGPLSDLSSSSFTYSLYQYPITENSNYTDQSHYIVFYINIPQESGWNTGSSSGPAPVANRGNTNATRFGLRSTDSNSTSDTGAGSSGLVSSLANSVLSSKTVRTTAAISLYIPATMVWSQSMQYENVSLTDALGPIGDLASLTSALASSSGHSAGGSLASLIPDIAKKFGASVGQSAVDTTYKALGIASNPQNFLLFKQIDFRKFQFDFILTPETANEASVLNQIIYLFRFHSVPEVLTGSLGRFFVPPSEFDIEILHNGNTNSAIPRISTCVCTGVNVDYAASGQFSTTYDGQPLQTRLTLDFCETVILTKDLVSSGF
jgi:hypothetical protein